MTKDLSLKKVALQKLLLLAEDRSFDIYKTIGGPAYGERTWPLNWSEYLYNIKKCSAKEQQERLDKTLFRLSEGDLPKTLKQLKREKLAIRLVLQAGADPNAKQGRDEATVFQCFMCGQKHYGALEVAKTSGFQYPENVDTAFRQLRQTLAFYLMNGRPYPLGTKEEISLNRQTTADDKELVKVLFKKRIYPHPKDLRKALAPIMTEENPQFFKQERKKVISQLLKSDNDLYYLAIMTGQQKEKE